MSRDARILGIRVTAQRFDEAIERILEAATGRVTFRAHFCTVHSLVEATSNPALADVFASASMVCTDGMPLVWVARRQGYPAERVAGPDTMPAICDRGRAIGLRHFFLGGADGVATALAASLVSRFPGLHVSGTYTPPFRPMTNSELQALYANVLESRANVVWIGLGSPKQDVFAAELAAAVPSIVVMPVGAAFDFHSGRLRRAPNWMRRIGLEWLFRLLMEPRRLWRRYLITNAKFAWLLALDLVRPHR